jgi:hypothetical protein
MAWLRRPGLCRQSTRERHGIGIYHMPGAGVSRKSDVIGKTNGPTFRRGLDAANPAIMHSLRNRSREKELLSADIVIPNGPTARYGAAGQEALMSTAPRFSDYIVAVAIAGLAAAALGVFLPGWPSSGIRSGHVQGSAIAPFFKFFNSDVAAVDRPRKGDRAPFSRIPASTPAAVRAAANTTIVLKGIVAPQFNGRGTIDMPTRQKAIEIDGNPPVPALPEGCEAQASSIADPTLARLIGRCLT